MNKIIIVLCAVLAMAYATDRVDDYIRSNYDQYKRILDGYDSELVFFRGLYRNRVEAVSALREKVVASLVHTNERLTPLLLLSDSSKQCVVKYSGRLASVEETKESCTKCELIATSQLETVLTASIKIRNDLENYLTNSYSPEVVKCREEHENNYTSCVSAAVSKANNFIYANQQSFEYELEAAECLAKANVKQVVDCTYTIEVDVLTTLGEVNALINGCLSGYNECKPCEKYTCAESNDIYGNYKNATITNPLHGRTDNPTCLHLNIH